MSEGPAARSRNGTRPGRPRALVAGAAGFIGSHLVARLLGEGWDVVGIDNLLTGDRANLELFAGHPRFTFHEHDVVEPLELQGRLDWLLHFASPASPPKYLAHPVHTLRSNAEGTFQLLQLARRKGGALLLASTSEVYGDSHEHPQRESYWGHVNPVGPRSVYDEGKRYAEAMALAYHRAHEVPVRVIRIFNTYGPRMRVDDGRVVVNFVMQALTGRALTIYGDGSQTRSYQYVDDLVEGVRRMMQGTCTGPVNLGNPDECTVLELARMVCRMTGARVPIVHGPLPVDDPRQRCPDITLATRALGWRPRVPVEEGLRRTIAWFRQALAAGGDRRIASDGHGVDGDGAIEIARIAHAAGGRDDFHRHAWRSPAP